MRVYGGDVSTVYALNWIWLEEVCCIEVDGETLRLGENGTGDMITD